MSDGQVKLSPAGKVLITAAGKVKICQCCVDDPEVLYREHRNCCNQCRSAYFRTDVRDDCSGSEGTTGTLLKWRGQCYDLITAAPTLTLAEAEATGRPVVLNNAEVECIPLSGSPPSCEEAQTAGACPICQECCIRWYPSKACLVGDIPSNPQNSVCCNLGRQVRFLSTCTFIDYAARVGDWISTPEGCFFTEPAWIIERNIAWNETTQCRWRAACPVGGACISLITNTRTRTGPGAPTPSTVAADCSVTTSGACTSRAIIPSQRSFCNASRYDSCVPFSCVGDQTRNFRPDPNGCVETPLSTQFPGAGCGLDAWPCYSLVIRASWACFRSCRSGSWSSDVTTTYRPYWDGWYCPGNPCEAQIIGVCDTRRSETVASVCEWEFIVEDEEGCLSDNVCFQYNGECLEATLVTPPEEICSDPVCEGPPGEEAMAPVFDPDSAGGGF